MADTQWPRFVVFQQSKAGEPHQYAGSVHAPDAEMALLNARDVFVRRPECASLWVVRADRILAKTAEELALDSSWLSSLAGPDQPAEKFYVFQKLGQKGVSRHVGEVEATSPHHALKVALERFANRSVQVWWIFPRSAVHESLPDDVETMFAQAWDKTDFRSQSEFPTVAWLTRIRGKARDETDEG